MGLFDRFSKKEQPASSQKMIESMLHIAQKCMEQNDYAKAVEMYKSILQLQPNAAAQYNLGSLYAQGKGVVRDFSEAGYWFRQAELSGDSEAGKMCTKCLMDHVQRGMGDKTAKDVYEDMTAFVRHVYPDRDAAGAVNRNLVELAQFHLGKQGFATAGKLLRAAAEFGADANAQNFLGVLYNAGMGVEENDLAALYWFDKAADQGVEKAAADRDGILNAYRKNLSAEEFYDHMKTLSGWCALGSRNVPRDAQKANRWNTVAEEAVRAQSAQEDAQPERDELDENILRIISELKERIQKTAPIRPGQRARFSYSNQNQLLHFGYIGVKCFGIDPECDDEFKGYRLLLEAECKYSGERRSDSVQYPFKSEEELFAFMDDPCGFPAACKKLVMRTHADRSPASAAEKDEHVNDKTDASDSANQASQSKAASSADYAHKRPDDRISSRFDDPEAGEKRIAADEETTDTSCASAETIPAYLCYPNDDLSERMYSNDMKEVSSEKCKYRFMLYTAIAETTPDIQQGTPPFTIHETHFYSKEGALAWVSVCTMQDNTVRSNSVCSWVESADKPLLRFGVSDALLRVPDARKGLQFKSVSFHDLGESATYNKIHHLDESHVYARVFDLGGQLYKKFILVAKKEDLAWRVEVNIPSQDQFIIPPDYVPAGQTFGSFYPLLTAKETEAEIQNVTLQEIPDKQVSSQRWNETTCMIVRLAFCGKVYRKDNHFAVRIGTEVLDLPGAKTLIDVCLQYYTLADSVQKKIESEYNRTWNTAHVLELVQNPEPYLPQMERVYEQIRTELPLMQDRPSVPQELFWKCPRRTAVLALASAEKDLNNVR